jgi:hypothetical protein
MGHLNKKIFLHYSTNFPSLFDKFSFNIRQIFLHYSTNLGGVLGGRNRELYKLIQSKSIHMDIQFIGLAVTSP